MPRQLWPRLGAATGTQPDTLSPLSTPEAPPEACRDCGMQYFRPSDTQSEAACAAGSLLQRMIQAGAPVKCSGQMYWSRPEAAVQGAPILSSDPARQRSPGSLVQHNRFAEALEILRPLGPGPSRTSRTCCFLLGLAAIRWVPGIRCRGRATACVGGRSHRGVPVHPDPPAGTGACASWNSPWPSI